MFASGDERRFGGSTLEVPSAADVETGRPVGRGDQNVISPVERNDVPRSAGPGGLSEATGEGGASVPGYFTERTGMVPEPLRGATAAMLGWVGRVTASVIERTVELVESVLPRGGYRKHGPPERAPPLPPGSAFSGAGVGDAGSLLAVLSLIVILARGGRFWPPYELPRPRLIPRPVSERPG